MGMAGEGVEEFRVENGAGVTRESAKVGRVDGGRGGGT